MPKYYYKSILKNDETVIQIHSTAQCTILTEEIIRVKRDNDKELGSNQTENYSFVNHSFNASDPETMKSLYLEIVVAVDHSVIEFHQKEKTRDYILTMMNIVNQLFRDPSLNINLKLFVKEIILLEKSEVNLVISGNSHKSLDRICQWFYQSFNESNIDDYDLGVFLTKFSLGGPSGYAPINGLCSKRRSCTLNRDEGLSSALIIAHEIGHVLGLQHDGEGNDCEAETYEGSIMSPIVRATFQRYHWSSCSREKLNTHIGNFKCLKDKPDNISESNDLQKAFYSLDEQCRQEFGHNYTLCKSFQPSNVCNQLWCGQFTNPSFCKSKSNPPLQGTICGSQKVVHHYRRCYQGYCLPIETKLDDLIHHNPQNGQWGTWSEFTPCSRSCGIGVRFRIRKCDNPRPLYGGKYCAGKSEELEICNIESCPFLTDFREEQCFQIQKYMQLSSKQSQLTWLPFEPEDISLKCKLTCMSKETKEFLFGENVIDGTYCSYDNRNSICIQGHCVKIGCDKILNSQKKEDLCGICGGNSMLCKSVNKIYMKIPTKSYSIVTTLPVGAHHIEIKEETNTDSFLALKLRNKEFILNGNNNQSKSTVVIHAGTKFIYQIEEGYEFLRAKGPLLTEVIVMINPSIIKVPVLVSTNYTIAVRKGLDSVTSIQQHFQWESKEWLPCSQSCGGGVQYKGLICRDRKTDKRVKWKNCDLFTKPVPQQRVCNLISCTFRWLTREWEPCTHTCGMYGIQNREIHCVLTNNTKIIIPPNFCLETKPSDTKSCNRVLCPSEWIMGSWSQCSASCGNGTQIRNAICNKSNEFSECPLPSPPTIRQCKITECSGIKIKIGF
ncbi:A disintegrin and metalloproteinase with thrombospondin motifs 3-like [Centruroides vittatus]|uniref:A disintegrin and metalloproteinase with thrombospondin motifs 3-like n=1 Tax=Centruroides vittatus TaxID=120091 RepID=UPI00350F3300